jgi:hypothetical protein
MFIDPTHFFVSQFEQSVMPMGGGWPAKPLDLKPAMSAI